MEGVKGIILWFPSVCTSKLTVRSLVTSSCSFFRTSWRGMYRCIAALCLQYYVFSDPLLFASHSLILAEITAFATLLAVAAT